MPAEADRRHEASREPAPLLRLALEYAIVEGESLDVAPAADALLEAPMPAAGGREGEPRWTHRLPRHVAALHGAAPAGDPAELAGRFQEEIARASRALERDGLRLMPSGMHPWMDPARELALWPGEGSERYAALCRAVDCKTHGIANACRAALALPFRNDEELARLHSAVRFLLPILPGLAASSPLVEGERNGVLDNRLALHRAAYARLPALAGEIVPEPVGSLEEYRDRVLEPLHAALAAHDPEGALRDAAVDARGAVVLPEAEAVEVSALDVQETPAMDAAYAALIAAVVRLLAAEQWADVRSLTGWRTESLARLLERAARDAERTEIGDRRYLAALGFRGGSVTLRRLWEHLAEQVDARVGLDERAGRMLEHYLRHGSLATRIAETCGLLPSPAAIARAYERLCESLATGEPFAPPAVAR
ncbi:MAG TPA: glutamate-cysteine ligase family protein [Gammaproteobacteria bacterium]